jgi:hypothetical protein
MPELLDHSASLPFEPHWSETTDLPLEEMTWFVVAAIILVPVGIFLYANVWGPRRRLRREARRREEDLADVQAPLLSTAPVVYRGRFEVLDGVFFEGLEPEDDVEVQAGALAAVLQRARPGSEVDCSDELTFSLPLCAFARAVQVGPVCVMVVTNQWSGEMVMATLHSAFLLRLDRLDFSLCSAYRPPREVEALLGPSPAQRLALDLHISTFLLGGFDHEGAPEDFRRALAVRRDCGLISNEEYKAEVQANGALASIWKRYSAPIPELTAKSAPALAVEALRRLNEHYPDDGDLDFRDLSLANLIEHYICRDLASVLQAPGPAAPAVWRAVDFEPPRAGAGVWEGGYMPLLAALALGAVYGQVILTFARSMFHSFESAAWTDNRGVFPAIVAKRTQKRGFAVWQPFEEVMSLFQETSMSSRGGGARGAIAETLLRSLRAQLQVEPES